MLLPAAGASADQRDPDLEPLFERLSHAGLPVAEARAVEQEIWNLWQASNSATIDLLLERATYLLQKGALDEAIQLLNQVVTLSPDYAEGWNKRATVYYMQDNFKNALKDVEHTLRLEPRHFGAWAGLGAMLVAMGEDRRALSAYQQALKINPHLADIKKEVARLELAVKGRGI